MSSKNCDALNDGQNDAVNDGQVDADIDSQTNAQPWLSQLNPQQRAAVTQLDGAVLVLAGAGTGKTRVLTHRLIHLIASGKAKPWQIMAVTFTNKAAGEMRERVRAMLDELDTGFSVEQIKLGTFHRIAAGMLRQHAEVVNLTSSFTILDRDDQRRLLKQILQQNNHDPKRHPPAVGLAVIDRWKDKALTPDMVKPSEGDGLWLNMYRRYQTRLQEMNACDFGDLLLHTLTIFQKRKDILAEYQSRIHYILVDEYQDTNVAQYLWLRLLAESRKNLCCVGDEDQAIYGWRGAEVDNILRFGDHFADAKIIRLEENYRSHGHILAAASGLIANNTNRLGKTLFTNDHQGAMPSVASYWNAENEAQTIATRILHHQRTDSIAFGNMAVLVRAGHLMAQFEKAFFDANIPYQVVGTKFFERREVLDAMAYLRVVAQEADDLAFQRIVNTPRRGLGPAKLDLIGQRAGLDKIPMLVASRRLVNEGAIKGAGGKNLMGLCESFVDWQKAMSSTPPLELTKRILNESGYLAMWQNSDDFEAEGRVEKLHELLDYIAPFASVGEFLEYASLMTDTDSMTNADGEDMGRVMLMTMHAAKGLEFDVVFLPAWEEEIFPSQQTIDEKGLAGLEEERRLAYVSMTRARRHLHISYAASRMVFGDWQARPPSQFIGELPRQHVEVQVAQQGGRQSYMPKPSPPRENKASKFRLGMRVFHEKFGNGNVLAVDADRDALSIGFDMAGEKRVKADFVTINTGSVRHATNAQADES